MSDQPENSRKADDKPDAGRRAWLLRLGLFAAAAYAAPTVLQIGDTAEAQGRRGRGRDDSDSDNRRRRGSRRRRRSDSDSDRRGRRRRRRDGRMFW